MFRSHFVSMPEIKPVCEVCTSLYNENVYLLINITDIFTLVSCIVIRGLAVGTVRNDNVKAFLCNEFRIGICLSLILSVVGCIRAAIFLVPLAETMAITTSLLMIVMISILIGATLPLLMHYVNIDPAHSSTTIQVLMDILGVTITVVVSSLILNSKLGRVMSPDLYARFQ